MVGKLFQLRAHETSVRTELVAGLTTFLGMVYIIFVNPQVLSAAGMDAGAMLVAICLAAALGTLVMGLWANYPIALAPGIGLNAYFAFTVVGTMGYSWQVALGAVFLSGCLFALLSLFCWQISLGASPPLSSAAVGGCRRTTLRFSAAASSAPPPSASPQGHRYGLGRRTRSALSRTDSPCMRPPQSHPTSHRTWNGSADTWPIHALRNSAPSACPTAVWP